MRLHETTFASPVGDLRLVFRGEVLCGLEFPPRRDAMIRMLRQRFGDDVELVPLPKPNGALKLLARYFEGELSAIDAIEVDLGGTPFQRRVWEELRRIPPGKPITYGELARRIGQPDAVRAVGTANGRNPVAVVVPCHRVVAAGGGLGGYGGGLPRKRWLLAHEESAALEG